MIKEDRVYYLGRRVKVKLSDTMICEGKLLGFGDGGTLELLEDDGFVHYCWPMLDVEEVEDASTKAIPVSGEKGQGSNRPVSGSETQET